MNDLKSLPARKLEPKDQVIKSSYESLLRRENRHELYKKLGPILFISPILGGMASILAITAVNPTESVVTSIVVGFMLGTVILSFVFMDKGQKRLFNKKQKRFFSFMHCYMTLKKYTSIEYSGEKKENKLVVKAFNELSKYILGWVDDRAPDSIGGLSNEIGTKINQRLIPLLKQQKSNESKLIHIFRDYLYDFALKVYDKDPSREELEEFDIQLDNFQDMPEAEPAKKPSFIEKLTLAKIASIGIFVGGILFFLLTFSELGWGQALGLSSTVSVGIMAFLGFAYRKNP